MTYLTGSKIPMGGGIAPVSMKLNVYENLFQGKQESQLDIHYSWQEENPKREQTHNWGTWRYNLRKKKSEVEDVFTLVGDYTWDPKGMVQNQPYEL